MSENNSNKPQPIRVRRVRRSKQSVLVWRALLILVVIMQVVIFLMVSYNKASITDLQNDKPPVPMYNSQTYDSLKSINRTLKEYTGYTLETLPKDMINNPKEADENSSHITPKEYIDDTFKAHYVPFAIDGVILKRYDMHGKQNLMIVSVQGKKVAIFYRDGLPVYPLGASVHIVGYSVGTQSIVGRRVPVLLAEYQGTKGTKPIDVTAE